MLITFRRLLAVAGAVAAAVALHAAPAAAEAAEHNCAGKIVSSFAGPGFGSAVAAGAQEQAIDNTGLANCGQPPRQNP